MAPARIAGNLPARTLYLRAAREAMKITVRRILPGLTALALGCCDSLAPGVAEAAQQPADLILYHGQVLTVDRAFSIKSALVVKDGRILAVGGDELARRYTAPVRIDLQGRTLMPGFMDTHMHIAGRSHRQIDLAHAGSIADIQRLIREMAAKLGPGEWITGSGWSEYELAEKRLPLRADLDAAAPANPVVLTRAGGHSSVGNSLALRLAKIDRNTPDPERGVIEHDPDGEPNGVIRERTDLYMGLVPEDTPAQMRPSYIAAIQALLPLGITSYIEAATSIADEVQAAPVPGTPPSGRTYLQMRSIYDEFGEQLPRATVEILYPGATALRSYPHHTGYGDDRLRIGAIGETAVDGGFTGPTAWTLVDYKGQPGFRGRAFYTRPQLQELLDTANELGWQVGLHAIGDAAIVMTVAAYDESLKKTAARPQDIRDRRWYLAHFTIMPPESTMQLMARDGILIAQQPNFTYTLEGRYTQTMDDWRVEHNNSLATPLHEGIHIAFGSDNLPIDPRVGLYAAITRKGMSGAVLGKEEAVTRAEAIRMYTANGPYLTWEEKKKGTLESGKFADMIVLDADPLTIAPEQLLTMKVDLTIVGGRVVYEREPAAARLAAATGSIPESETSDVAVLGPLGPRRLFLSAGFMGGVRLINGDTAKIEAGIPAAAASNFAIDPNGRYYYVAETMWSRGNRGPREDLLSVYDDQIHLVAEIPLPGRLVSVPRSSAFDVSADGHWAYVYNMQPAQSVVVVDLSARKVATQVETPGCGMVYPWSTGAGENGFASLCADGSLATASREAKGRYTVTHTERFFDPEQDPVFEESLVDRQTGHAWFISYSGLVYPATLGAHAQIDSPWSIQQAAGLSRATISAGQETWRPGGARLAALHKASGRLFVLMHEGLHWTQKEPGAEIWVLDANTHKLKKRLTVPQAATVIAVSQDASPLLYAVSRQGWLWVLNPDTGEVLHSLKDLGMLNVASVAGF